LGHAAMALVNRDLIGQAKGILMERFKITADQAFDVLAKVSQDTNRKLYAVAEDLTRTGMLDA
jgi:AmiR/NasT family two-component response regulator